MISLIRYYSTRFCWAGVFPCIFVLAASGLALLFFAIAAYFVGRDVEDQRRFLVNYRTPTWEELGLDFTMNYILNSKEYNDVVFHGDSTCRYGVNVVLFQDQSGLKAFNIGSTVWTGWKGYTLLLRRYLENHPKPKAIVFCISPFNLSEHLVNNYIFEKRLELCFGYESEDAKPIHANSFRYYTAEGIRSIYGSFLPKNKKIRGKGTRELIEEWNSNRGSVLLNGVSTDFIPYDLEFIEITSSVFDHLTKIATVAQQNDTLFVIRFMPLWKGAAKLSERTENQLRLLEREFSNVVISRPLLLDYDFNLFFDNFHINHDGGTKFNSFLVAELGEIFKARNIRRERD